MRGLPRNSVRVSAVVLVAALCVAVAVLAATGTFSSRSKRATPTAEQPLHKHVRAAADSRYQLLTAMVQQAQRQLSSDKHAVVVARHNLAITQKALARRLVSLYTSRNSKSTLAVIGGAKSLDDLINRVERLNPVGS